MASEVSPLRFGRAHRVPLEIAFSLRPASSRQTCPPALLPPRKRILADRTQGLGHSTKAAASSMSGDSAHMTPRIGAAICLCSWRLSSGVLLTSFYEMGGGGGEVMEFPAAAWSAEAEGPAAARARGDAPNLDIAK